MKKYLLPLAAVLLIVSLPAFAARIATVPLTHPEMPVYQVYPGDSMGSVISYAGYLGTLPEDLITVVPGILSIVPGENWANFVGAVADNQSYSIKNVTIQKTTPQIIQCADVFPARVISLSGTPNVRLWWPLMYEVPGTTWTLTILYGTTTPYDDDGAGPNPLSYVHTERWLWKLDVDLDRLGQLLALFREVPFGLDEVPLISDEELFVALLAKLEAIAVAPDDLSKLLVISDFEMEVMDACIAESPKYPNPTGPGTGIANSLENPACCKLLADIEYIGNQLGVLQPGK